jgi:hypothetical protein
MVSEKGKRIDVEKWCNNTAWRKESIRGKTLFKCHCVQQESYIVWPGIEPGSPRMFSCLQADNEGDFSPRNCVLYLVFIFIVTFVNIKP